MSTTDLRNRVGSGGIATTPDAVSEMEERWEDPPGLIGFITTVDHKRIGIRYIVTAFIFFLLAGLMAMAMRAQLAQPDSDLVGPDAYNQLFTMHGTLMIFLFNTPVLAGFGNYLLPLMLGARDMAFPRLNAFGYWVFLAASVFMLTSFAFGDAPDAGWFAYTPLTGGEHSPGRGIDYWGLGVVFVGVSTTTGAINFLVTTLKMRAPGMSLNRIPIFVWSIVAMALMIIFAVPLVTLAAGLLELDRLVGTAFFDPDLGGSSLLYQHLFWFWGHPEVYILFLPAVGMVSTIIPVAARQRLAGYLWTVAAFLAIAFISFGVWVHHMFATGLPAQASGFFAAASLVIAVPSGVLYFCWIATMLLGRVRRTVPMLFCLGFLLIFLAGGITGVMVSSLPFDVHVTDSYFIVAHFHYVLNGAVVFPIFAAVYYWFPKMIGRDLSGRLGRWSFWIMVVAFQFAFFPMHVLGLLGMPRRIFTYEEGLGWEALNLLVSLGSAAFAIGVGLTIWNVLWSWRRGVAAAADPWDADTLEWAVTSPAPEYNFAAMPQVESRHPLWEREPLAFVEDGDSDFSEAGALRRRMTLSDGVEAVPSGSLPVPRPTWLPFVFAAGMLVLTVGALYRAVPVLVVGGALGLVGLARWTWRMEAEASVDGEGRSVAWWGVAWMIATEATLFAGLLSSWFFVRAGADSWPLDGIEAPKLERASIFTVVLLGSSLPMWWAERSARHGLIGRMRLGFALSWLLGAVFLVNQVLEYDELRFGWQDNAYASLFYVITGLHGLHVLAGLAMGGVLQAKAALGLVGEGRHSTLRVVALYWHFVDVVWIAVFSSLYLSTHLQ